MSDLSNIFGNGFDNNQELPPTEFDLVPPNWYSAIIEKSEVKSTSINSKSAGKGHYINVQFCIVDGPYKGRKIFKNFNIQNPNETAANIGLRELQKLNNAIDLRDKNGNPTAIFNDTNQHLNQLCLIRVIEKKDRNDISAFKRLEEQALTSVSHASEYVESAAQSPKVPSNNTPPWLR